VHHAEYLPAAVASGSELDKHTLLGSSAALTHDAAGRSGDRSGSITSVMPTVNDLLLQAGNDI
jgi:hypothetical protein